MAVPDMPVPLLRQHHCCGYDTAAYLLDKWLPSALAPLNDCWIVSAGSGFPHTDPPVPEDDLVQTEWKVSIHFPAI